MEEALYILNCTWKWRVTNLREIVFGEGRVDGGLVDESSVSHVRKDRIAIRDLVCSSWSQSVALLVLYLIRYYARNLWFSRTWFGISCLVPCRVVYRQILVASLVVTVSVKGVEIDTFAS